MADNPDPSTTTNTTAEPSSLTSQPTAQCAQCGKSPSTLKQCNKCHSVSYCDKDCQKAHFKTHKKVCAGLAQEYVKANAPKMASGPSGGGKGGAREKGLQKWQVRDMEEAVEIV